MEKMTKKQLQAIADRKNITYNSKTTKSELIALIEGAKKPAKRGADAPGEY